jgi:hypothetical protein
MLADTLVGYSHGVHARAAQRVRGATRANTLVATQGLPSKRGSWLPDGRRLETLPAARPWPETPSCRGAGGVWDPGSAVRACRLRACRTTECVLRRSEMSTVGPTVSLRSACDKLEDGFDPSGLRVSTKFGLSCNWYESQDGLFPTASVNSTTP